MRDAIGYPVHALAEYREWTDEHGVTFVEHLSDYGCRIEGDAVMHRQIVEVES